MDDMSSRLNEILNDPASMEKIRNLAAMFGNSNQQGGQAPAQQQQPQQQQPQQQQHQRQQNTQNQQSTQSGAPGIDPEMMRSVMKLAPVFSHMRQDDSSTQLLRALRPFLGDTRRGKLDEALRILQLIRMLPYLRNSGIFQSFL